MATCWSNKLFSSLPLPWVLVNFPIPYAPFLLNQIFSLLHWHLAKCHALSKMWWLYSPNILDHFGHSNEQKPLQGKVLCRSKEKMCRSSCFVVRDLQKWLWNRLAELQSEFTWPLCVILWSYDAILAIILCLIIQLLLSNFGSTSPTSCPT